MKIATRLETQLKFVRIYYYIDLLSSS